MEALTLICLHVEPHVYPYVRNTNKAKDTWDELAKVFEDKGLNRRISLIDALLDEKLSKHKNIHNYVTSVMSISQKLTDIGKGLDDDLIAVVMLRGLPEEYKPMKMALENSGVSVTSEMVRVKLLQEDLKSNSNGTGRSEESVLLAKGRQFNKNSRKKSLRCYRCGQRGHIKPECTFSDGSNHVSKSNKRFEDTSKGKEEGRCHFEALSVSEKNRSAY